MTWNVVRWRTKQGILGALLGSALTVAFLAFTDNLGGPLVKGDATGSNHDGIGGGLVEVVGQRHLWNLPCPCAAGESSEAREHRQQAVVTSAADPERRDMIKLMNMLMQKLNRTLQDRPTPPQQHLEYSTLLPVVTVRRVPAVSDGPVPPHDPTTFFRPVVTPPQKVALYTALLELKRVSDIHGYQWMLYSGTLLGSFRHHDMVPWDDDFDIFMNYTQRDVITTTLSNLEPRFHLFEAGSRLKFWCDEGTVQGSKYPWKWPYLDISFFKENRTHIWDGSMEDDYGDRLYLYPKEIVFPLHLRPMGKYFFPAPRDSFRHIQLTYKAGGLGLCLTTHYSHKNEALTERVHKIMCRDLKHLYAFVHRTPHDKGVMETLKLDGKEVHHVFVPEPRYAITEPYAIKLLNRS